MARSTLRDQLKPIEFVGLSAVLALFAGLVVLLASREWLLALIFFGVAFIVALVVIAMFALTMKPNSDELRELSGEGVGTGIAETEPADGEPASADAAEDDQAEGDGQSPR